MGIVLLVGNRGACVALYHAPFFPCFTLSLSYLEGAGVLLQNDCTYVQNICMAPNPKRLFSVLNAVVL